MAVNPGSIAKALRQTFLKLDEEFLASRKYSEMVSTTLLMVHHVNIRAVVPSECVHDGAHSLDDIL